MQAIFSDDSDAEVEEAGINQTEDPQKKTEAASAALSRLVAGDFLESLGKELGLEVPPDIPPPTNKAGTSSSSKHVPEDSKATGTLPQELPPSGSSDNHGHPAIEGIESKPLKHTVGNEDIDREKSPSNRKKNEDNDKLDREDGRDGKAKHERRSSSGDDRSRKRSRRHRLRHSSSDGDSSSSSEDQYRSRSREHKRRSSRKKHRRRKHSKHK